MECCISVLTQSSAVQTTGLAFVVMDPIVQLVDMVMRYVDSKAAQKPSAAAGPDPRHKAEVIRGSPAVKFLTRTDFFSLVQYSDVSIYNVHMYVYE